MSKPAVAARGNAGEPPANVITTVEFCFFRNEQAQKRLANISKPNDGKVVRRNGCSSTRMLRSQAILELNFLVYFAASFAAADEMSAASSLNTAATTMMASSACFHCFCSMASRTAGTVFTA